MNTTQHTLRSGKTTVLLNVKARDWKRSGVVHEGKCRQGHHVAVTPGESIRVFGSGERIVSGKETGTGRAEHRVVKYDVTFRVGQVAVYGGMNLTYTGTIRSIGPKTVAIVAYEGTSSEKVIKLDLEQFSHLNEYFDLAKIQRRNSEWMD